MKQRGESPNPENVDAREHPVRLGGDLQERTIAFSQEVLECVDAICIDHDVSKDEYVKLMHEVIAVLLETEEHQILVSLQALPDAAEDRCRQIKLGKEVRDESIDSHWNPLAIVCIALQDVEEML